MNTIKEYACTNNIPIMDSEGLNFLINFIKENKIEKILELGSAIGYSAINMALVNENIEVVTIERDAKRYEEALKNIRKFKLDSRIKIYNIDAFDYVDNSDYDLLLIDAAKAQNEKFFIKFGNKAKYIITDNLSFHGLVGSEIKMSKNVRGLVRKIESYIEFLKNNKEYKTKFYQIGDGISVSMRDFNERI